MSLNKTRVYLDAVPLAKPHPSGIGHLLHHTCMALLANREFADKYELILFAPHNMVSALKNRYGETVKVRSLLYPAARIVNGLNYNHVLPPIDLLLGRGIYLFGNYSNYPVTKRSRSLTWVHDLSFVRHGETVAPKLRHHLVKNVPGWIARTTKVVAISEFSRQELLDYYKLPESKVVIVKGGVDLELFKATSNSAVAEVKREHNLPDKYVVFIGNLEPRKNLESLVRAFAALPAALTRTYALLLVGGDGWNNQDIHIAIEKARRRGVKIVTPSGYISDSDLPAVICGSELLVHPALYEGFGLTPLEALACHKQVLVSDIPPLREVVGAFGNYFDLDGSDSALTSALRQALERPLAVSADVNAWIQRYTWERSAEQLLCVLHDLSATI